MVADSLALFLCLQLTIDVSFHKFKPTFIQFFQQGQYCAEDIFIAVIIVLYTCLICCSEGAAATRLTMMGRVVGRVQRIEATSIGDKLPILISSIGVYTAVPVGCLLTSGNHLIIAIVLGHITSRCL